MSVESLSLAFNVHGVTAAERLVLLGIANHDGDGGAWPSIATLARYACVTERSVQRTIRALVGRGLVGVATNKGGTLATRNDHRPNRYTLHLQRGDTGVGASNERGDASVADGVTPTSPEPSFNHPITPLPPKRRRTKRGIEPGLHPVCDYVPLTPEQIAAKFKIDCA